MDVKAQRRCMPLFAKEDENALCMAGLGRQTQLPEACRSTLISRVQDTAEVSDVHRSAWYRSRSARADQKHVKLQSYVAVIQPAPPNSGVHTNMCEVA